MKIFLTYLVIMTLITYMLYLIDKKRSKKAGARRISEKVLLLFSLLGGALGGYLAMIMWHHKTKHWYFVLINVLGIVAYTVIVYYMIKGSI